MSTAALRTGLLGKKLGMTQIFNELGDRTGVTVIHAGTCVVVGKRTPDKDGYSALRVGWGQKPLRLANRAEKGAAGKLDIAPPRTIREIRLDPRELDKFEVGKPIALSAIFKPGTYVDVTGTTKGKGFQGVLKRHHLGGSRNTHGTHEFFRHGGSIGCRLTPGRVHKGKRMTGHLGDVQRTVQNVALMQVLDDEGLLLVRGAVPGGKNGMVLVKNSIKRTGTVRLGEAEETKGRKAMMAKKPPAKKK